MHIFLRILNLLFSALPKLATPWVLGGMIVLLPGCSHLFYQPHKNLYVTPKQVNLSYEEVRFQASDGVQLSAWLISGGPKARGTLLQFHGNAENMSTHFLQLAWLANSGFNLMVFDYRGYGSSAGIPDRAGTVKDGIAAIQWLHSQPKLAKNIFVIGQSLGGAIAVPAVAQAGEAGVRALILDSTFASYRQIARLKLNDIWLTWPLQYPLSFLVSDDLSPEDFIAELKLPKLFMHSHSDPVVPYAAVEDLYAAAHQPKELWLADRLQHLEMLGGSDDQYRQRFLQYLCQHLEQPQAGCVMGINPLKIKH